MGSNALELCAQTLTSKTPGATNVRTAQTRHRHRHHPKRGGFLYSFLTSRLRPSPRLPLRFAYTHTSTCTCGRSNPISGSFVDISASDSMASVRQVPVDPLTFDSLLTASSKLPTSRAHIPATTSPTVVRPVVPQVPRLELSRYFPIRAA